MKNVKRARQAMAQDQAAWNRTMQRGEKVQRADSTQFQAKRVHYILADETLACGLPWEMDNVGTETMEEVSCNQCVTAAHDVEPITQGEEAMQETTMPMHLTTLFTLAPATMDKGDTQEVPCAYLYDNEPVRQVLTPKPQATAQMNAYLSPIPFIAFDEAGLTYYIKKGKVTKAQSHGIAFDPIAAVIALNTTKKEDPIMPAKKKASVTPQVQPLATMTPLGILPEAKIRTLDAILAAPIVAFDDKKTPAYVEQMQHAAKVVADSPEGRQNAALAARKKHLALPEERSEQAIVQALVPGCVPAYSLAHDPLYVQLAQLVVGLQNTVKSLEARLSAMQSAPMTPEPAPYDPMADCLAAIAEAETMHQKPAKPKSTLRIYTQSTAVPKTARQRSGKTDPAIIKAIQQAWKSGKVSQADLAVKYGMDSKKVWFFCNRAKQLV